MTLITQLDYDVVLATRNRQNVLSISIPLMLRQTRLPRRFIVVDSSDNHSEVRDILECEFSKVRSAIELFILQADPGSSRQRNIGLRHVASPIVIFPDDDSLWFPDSAESLLRVYERDREQILGCVALTATPTYPQGAFDYSERPHELEWRDRIARRIRRFVGTFEDTLFPDPINSDRIWSGLCAHRKGPNWLPQEEAILCGTVFGYRMSYRTKVIQRIGGFDENLGRYAMFEDSDASIGSLHTCFNARSARALVHHYRVPGKRVGGWEFGLMAILNRAYVVCKHTSGASPVRRTLKRYIGYKLVRYLLQCYSDYGRKRLTGAVYAATRVDELLSAPPDQLAARYMKIRDERHVVEHSHSLA